MKLRRSGRGIWDYDIRRLDLSDPRIRAWYAQRKIETGDWRALNRRILRETLPKLSLDPHLRGLLQRFLNER